MDVQLRTYRNDTIKNPVRASRESLAFVRAQQYEALAAEADWTADCNGIGNCPFGHGEWRRQVRERIHNSQHHVYRVGHIVPSSSRR